MIVRGAPAIGCSAGYAFHVDVFRNEKKIKSWGEYEPRFREICEILAASRPTAVNLFYAIDQFKEKAASYMEDVHLEEVEKDFKKIATGLYEDDLATCKFIGEFSLKQVKSDKVNVLTHCNTGSLATAGYGTALGVIRSLHENNQLGEVYVDETRPYLQGARLTAFELQKDKIPFKLICDSVAATLMAQGKVDWVVVGADRIAANGDTANKIGTYSLAVNANFHNVDFYVAAPLTTFDASIRSGSDIPIEERSPEEVTGVFGHPVALPETQVFNPSFDVTPGSLITGIFTECGMLSAPFIKSINEALTS
jgi:methylthioribose-1-phosphate isomerase